MLVEEIMTSPAVTVRRGAPLHEAIELLARKAITALPVVDARGRLVGVLSEADVLERATVPDSRAHLDLQPEWPGPQEAGVEDLMNRQPLWVRPEDDVATAVRVMTENLVKSLPVVEGERVVGVVSRHDVMRTLDRPDEDVEAEVDAVLNDAGLDWSVSVTNGTVTVSGPATPTQQTMAGALVSTVRGVTGIRLVAD